MIPYGKQSISSEDVDAVSKALQDEFLTQGPRVSEFEERLADYLGVKSTVVVNSATSALHIACLALGVGPGDLVWTSAISFVASANAAKYCGADVDFVDIEPSTFNISAHSLGEKLAIAASSGQKLPKVVIPVSMAGQSPDMESIFALSQTYGFRIIEDNSHALGAEHLGVKVGGCQFSDISVFSFHPVKMITTGEGGACSTNNLALARRMERLRSHGITRSQEEMVSPRDIPYYYEQLELGYNYRITDFQCALGISQLKRLDEFVAVRNAIASSYSLKLDRNVLDLPFTSANNVSSFHLYIVRIKEEFQSIRDELFHYLRSLGIMVNLHYIPIYRHPYYWNTGLYSELDFPNAESYFRRAISLPIHPSLDDKEVDFVSNALMDYWSHARSKL